MNALIKICRKNSVRQFVAFVLACTMVFNTSIVLADPMPDALPSGGNVVSGSATFDDTITGELHINDVADKTIINWSNFDIGSDAMVQFQQVSNDAAVLNRILTASATEIFGQLQANG